MEGDDGCCLSHRDHPTHVMKGLVRCLYDRARNIVIFQEDLQKREEHLTHVLVKNNYPATFICTSSSPSSWTTNAHPGKRIRRFSRPPLVMISYVAGVSEDIRCVCRKFDMKVTFKSRQTLCLMLTKVKYILPLAKQSNVVYQIPHRCGEVYIGETK